MTLPLLTVPDIINGIIEREQGFVNNPNDRGGPTKWGVTERVARKRGYTGKMIDLPRSFAFETFFDAYYRDPHFDLVLNRSYSLGIAMADAGVLCSTERVTKWLQVILNVLNREQKIYRDIKVDGEVGNVTITALNAFLNARGKEGERVLIRAFYSMLGAHFIEISINRPANEDFIYGWFLHRMNLV